MYLEVSNWIDHALSQDIPKDVAAFCFNLYEDMNDEWSMEIVGAARFDLIDEDWPCDEVTTFGTREGLLAWQKVTTWDTVLAEMVSVLKEYLEHGKYAAVLKSTAGVGVGFVDGNIEILYHK